MFEKNCWETERKGKQILVYREVNRDFDFNFERAALNGAFAERNLIIIQSNFLT